MRRHELRSYEPMRPRTWERKQGKRGVRDHNLVTNPPQVIRWEKNCLLLGVVEFIVIVHHSPFLFPHHVPLDGTGSNDVDQLNHWQAGADQFVLQKNRKNSVKYKCSLAFTQILHLLTHTHLEAVDMCMLVFWAQGGVDPGEDDIISNLLSITQI